MTLFLYDYVHSFLFTHLFLAPTFPFLLYCHSKNKKVSCRKKPNILGEKRACSRLATQQKEN
jgi:hypothetical protein